MKEKRGLAPRFLFVASSCPGLSGASATCFSGHKKDVDARHEAGHDGERDRFAVPDRLALAILALVALIAAATFRDYGLGWDDFTHAQYGNLLLAFYGSGFQDRRALEFVNLYLYGGGFDMAAALLAKLLPFVLFETRRLTGAIVGITGLAVTWRIARRAGGPLAGLMALLLLAACPLYVGHMFINPKDSPFAVAMAVFLLGLVRILEEYPRPRPSTLVILGLGFGLSIGSRIMAGFGVIAAVAAIAFLVFVDARATGWRTAGARLRTVLLRLLPAAVLAYAAMALLWPWGVVDPLNPFRALGVFSTFFEKPWQELFEGVLLTPPDMPRRYVPELIMLKLPELFVVLGIGGALLALTTAAQAGTAPQRRAVHLAIVLSALLPVAVAVLTRPAMYNGIRHFVFVLPPLAVLGGIAGAALVERAARYGGIIRAMVVVAIAVGIAAPVVTMARTHPYEYAAFNHVAGGVAARAPVEGRGVRPAPRRAGRAWRSVRAELGRQGRRLCAVARRILLREARRTGDRHGGPRRGEVRDRVRSARPRRRRPVRRPTGPARRTCVADPLTGPAGQHEMAAYNDDGEGDADAEALPPGAAAPLRTIRKNPSPS